MRLSSAPVAVPILALTVLAGSGLYTPLRAQQTTPPLEVGATAPDFSVSAATRYGVVDQPIQLSDFAGKTVVLAFFPKARTRGCTIQMHAYRDQYADLFRAGQDVVLIAMSADPVEELYAWARDDQFQFLMASDIDLEVAEQYGAVREEGAMTNRNLFVIAPNGTISYRATPFQEIDPAAYAELDDALAAVMKTAARD